MSSSSSSGGLPGMKRGIAVGVGVCLAIIIIALVTHLMIKRRRRLRKLQEAKSVAELETGLSPEIKITIPEEAKVRQHSVFVEPDSSPIHEMAGDMRLRGSMDKSDLAELKGDERTVFELDASEAKREQSNQDEKNRYLNVGR